MRRAILTIGPQGAGKSTFCEKVVEAHPEVILVSRDVIRMELFGTVFLDRYTGGGEYAQEKMWEAVKGHLSQTNVVLILDCWNGYGHERTEMTRRLRESGADRVDGWYFTTPRETCVHWRLVRDGMEKERDPPGLVLMDRAFRTELYGEDYVLFHAQAIALDQGFDSIRQINPLELPLPYMPFL